MTADAASSIQLTGTSTRVHGDGLLDDKAIGDEFADGLARVGIGNLRLLVRVQPDLALAAVGNRGREALLRAEIGPGKHFELAESSCWRVQGRSRSRGVSNAASDEGRGSKPADWWGGKEYLGFGDGNAYMGYLLTFLML
jgi:hypothetical protein